MKTRKPFIGMALVAIIIIVLAMTACSSGGGGDGSVDKTENSGGGTFTATASVTYDPKYFTCNADMNEAKSITDFGAYHRIIVNEPVNVTVNGGNVTIKLGTVKNERLEDPSFLIQEGISVSPSNAKGLFYEGIHYFFWTPDHKYALALIKDFYNYAFLIYADRDVTIKGTFSSDEYTVTENWNVSMKKGWNYVIYSENEATKTGTFTSSTTQPSDFKWTVMEK